MNEWSGLHPVEYLGRGIKYNLGANTGLVHEYTDFTVTNGKTYYYAVVSYDHGFDSLGTQLPPSESQASITQDPITKAFQFDVNTVAVTPGPLASGIVNAGLEDGGAVPRVNGISTGQIAVRVLDDLAVLDKTQYNIEFNSVGSRIVYNVRPLRSVIEPVTLEDCIILIADLKRGASG